MEISLLTQGRYLREDALSGKSGGNPWCCFFCLWEFSFALPSFLCRQIFPNGTFQLVGSITREGFCSSEALVASLRVLSWYKKWDTHLPKTQSRTSNLDACGQRSGERRCGPLIQWNITWPLKRNKLGYLQWCGWWTYNFSLFEVRKRKTNTIYLGKWYRWTYLQGRNRHADVENEELSSVLWDDPGRAELGDLRAVQDGGDICIHIAD